MRFAVSTIAVKDKNQWMFPFNRFSMLSPTFSECLLLLFVERLLNVFRLISQSRECNYLLLLYICVIKPWLSRGVYPNTRVVIESCDLNSHTREKPSFHMTRG